MNTPPIWFRRCYAAPWRFATALALVFVVACTGVAPDEGGSHSEPVSTPAAAPLVEVDPEPEEDPISPVPSVEDVFEELEVDYEPAMITLGERLFHDPRLSSDDTLSCASCHDLRYGGVDRAPTLTGIHGQVGPINTPTVFNSVFNVSQFWDGRAKNLEEQAGGPPVAPGEMGSTWDEILGKLRRDERYAAAFAESFEDVETAADIKKSHVLEAIATFELTLITPGCRFDRWLEGDKEAISETEARGYELFKSVGCADCHYGPVVGGKTYQRLGSKREFFTDPRVVSHVDQGRFNVTKDERDLHFFKVPSLRNVELTGPWFHDGSQKTLDSAVKMMARHQLDVELNDADTAAIVAFLRSLTGYYKGRFLGAPMGNEDPTAPAAKPGK